MREFILVSSPAAKVKLTYTPLPFSGIVKLLPQHQEVDYIRHVVVSASSQKRFAEAVHSYMHQVCAVCCQKILVDSVFYE